MEIRRLKEGGRVEEGGEGKRGRILNISGEFFELLEGRENGKARRKQNQPSFPFFPFSRCFNPAPFNLDQSTSSQGRRGGARVRGWLQPKGSYEGLLGSLLIPGFTLIAPPPPVDVRPIGDPEDTTTCSWVKNIYIYNNNSHHAPLIIHTYS